jgi:hypothetical protein
VLTEGSACSCTLQVLCIRHCLVSGAPLLDCSLHLGGLHEHLQYLLVAHRYVAVRVGLRVHSAEVLPLLRSGREVSK